MAMSSEIRILEYKKVNLRDATVIDGIPSSGLGCTILANYLIGQKNLDQIAAVDSEDFPPISMVYDSKPKYPARIYASEADKLAVFLAEFRPLLKLDRSIAKSILLWAKKQGCVKIVSTHQFVLDEEAESGLNLAVYGVGSTDNARKQLTDAGVTLLGNGVITGLPGVLLNEGRWMNFDICTLIVGVQPRTTNVRIAATLIGHVMKLLPNVKVDVKPLTEEAERIEERLRMLRKQASPVEPPQTPQLYT